MTLETYTMSVSIQSSNNTRVPRIEISTDKHITLSHRTRKRIREAKKKARPGKNKAILG